MNVLFKCHAPNAHAPKSGKLGSCNHSRWFAACRERASSASATHTLMSPAQHGAAQTHIENTHD